MTDARQSQTAVERTVELDAPVERVWRAISDAGELARWFPQRADWDLRPGGSGAFFWDGYGEFPVEVVAVEPPRYLAWRWGLPQGTDATDGQAPTLVEWWVEERPGDRSALRVRESGFRTPKDRAESEGGWAEELVELADLVRRGPSG